MSYFNNADRFFLIDSRTRGLNVCASSATEIGIIDCLVRSALERDSSPENKAGILAAVENALKHMDEGQGEEDEEDEEGEDGEEDEDEDDKIERGSR